MPKCDNDVVLQDDMLRYMEEQRLSVSAAASKLGLERSTLWRFCQSGRARSDTRAAYRKALASARAETATSVALGVAVKAAGALHADAALGRLPTAKELKRIKNVCEGLLALVAMYEAQLKAAKG